MAAPPPAPAEAGTDQPDAVLQTQLQAAHHLRHPVEIDDGMMAGGVDVAMHPLQRMAVIDRMGAGCGEDPLQCAAAELDGIGRVPAQLHPLRQRQRGLVA